MKYRLFLAIDPPELIRKSLISLCSGLENIKWVSEEQIHLTLRFIGDADGSVLQDIVSALSSLEIQSFLLKPAGVGFFPPKGTPKVLWAGLETNAELVKMYRSVNNALETYGLEKEHRKFYPHLTLGRIKEESTDSIADYLSRNNNFHSQSFPVNEYHLYTSHLTAKGAIHEKIASFPLS
jgi:2'-5' RNA ligase